MSHNMNWPNLKLVCDVLCFPWILTTSLKVIWRMFLFLGLLDQRTFLSTTVAIVLVFHCNSTNIATVIRPSSFHLSCCLVECKVCCTCVKAYMHVWWSIGKSNEMICLSCCQSWHIWGMGYKYVSWDQGRKQYHCTSARNLLSQSTKILQYTVL